MLNIERYREDLKEKGDGLLECNIQFLMGKSYCMRFDGCSACRKECIEWLLSEYKEPILTDEEKKYLKAVIEPFKDRVNHLRKYIHLGHGTEYVEFVIDDHTMSIDLPDFESGTKYKGMELGREYTLEELGL